jgi:hypothetical protein
MPPKRPFIGVATTTPIACLIDDQLLLEPMNVLSEEGCGVPTAEPAPIGKIIAVAFRLSSSKRTILCKAVVLGEWATTPAGLELRAARGDDAFASAMSMGSSATSIVRRGDLEKMHHNAAQKPKLEGSAVDKTYPVTKGKGAPGGLCLRFVDLGPEDLSLVRDHIRSSREIEAKLAIGAASDSSDRKLGLFFDDPKLSDKANDW